jgi:hypothetical protein
MIDNNWDAVDRIDHAERENPYCVCGLPTVAVGCTDGVWLECSSLAERHESAIGRFLSALASHTRLLIVEEDAAA